MKQIIQSFKTGNTELIELPSPKVEAGQILIRTTRSLVSIGTERMLVEFGKASLVQKARQQPEKVKMVLDKIKSEGLLPTLENVFSRLEQPLPLGYCNVGEVIDIGSGVKNFKIGDRVASNGAHAEFVCVPQNLAVKIPNNVTDEEATFTVIGSIALQGVRLAKPSIGETFVIIGLGLVGLLTAEILIANGCKVIGYDLDDKKVEIAKAKGIIAFNPKNNIDPVKFVLEQTADIGADAVLITASSKTNDIISDSASMSRKRGRIVLIGVVGLNISRSDFYQKELSFQVSCSYGPGRYDSDYEFKGIDYPLPYVRWTEKRNFQTILNLISSAKISVKEFISELVPLDQFDKIYNSLNESNSIGSIIKYIDNTTVNHTVIVNNKFLIPKDDQIAIVGAGNYTKMTMLPFLKKANANIKHIVSSKGLNGTVLAKKYQIPHSTTDYNLVLNDEEVDLVMITTRHNLHADMVISALDKNKHVFVEKPLAITENELLKINNSYNNKNNNGTLMVGFNRRFSPHIKKIKSLAENSIVNIVATMNAGSIPPEVWVHDMQIGGGRIIGEACHYLDLMVFISGSKIKSICMNALGINPLENTDNASILVKMENGSTGVINYFSNGSKQYSKERIEVYSQERTLIMDNFRETLGYGFNNFKKLKTKIDKGHNTQFQLVVNKLKEGSIELIPYEELFNVTRASFLALKSMKEGKWMNI